MLYFVYRIESKQTFGIAFVFWMGIKYLEDFRHKNVFDCGK